MTLSPLVYWAQTESHVYLRADLRDVHSHDVCIEEEEVELSAVAKGAGGDGNGYVNANLPHVHGLAICVPCRRYHFVIEFFLPVDKSDSDYEIRDRDIRFTFRKKEADWWPRLLYENVKVPWLRIDFDKWQDEDDRSSGDEEAENSAPPPDISSHDWIKHKYPEAYRKLQMEEQGYITESRRKIYLFCYNLFMVCGFVYVAIVLGLRYAKLGDDFLPECYAAVGKSMCMLALMAVLEVLHPLFGYTKVT